MAAPYNWGDVETMNSGCGLTQNRRGGSPPSRKKGGMGREMTRSRAYSSSEQGIDGLFAAEDHLEMQLRAGRNARRADFADLRAAPARTRPHLNGHQGTQAAHKPFVVRCRDRCAEDVTIGLFARLQTTLPVRAA